MKKLFCIITLLLFYNCQSQNKNLEFNTEWFEVKLFNYEFQVVDCGYEGEWFKIKNDSIYDHGVMEELNLKIFKTFEIKDTLYVYIDQDRFYKLFWVNHEKGIIKREDNFYGNISRYYVNKKNFKEFSKVKGSSRDCIEIE
jgi:hypothetical protein